MKVRVVLRSICILVFMNGSSKSHPGRSEAAIGGAKVAELLDDVRAFVRRYVMLSDAQADAVALWVAHTHAFESAESTPYLEISSAEKESGKTRLLETLELIVARPWLTGRTTISALARKVDAELPTLLLDESDAALAGDKTYVQELRGILNSGFRRGAKYTVNVPTAASGWTPTDFSVFCPKAIAGIGSLPDTIVSRSITIRLQRKRSEETVEKLRFRRVAAAAEPLRQRLEQVLPAAVEALIDITEAEPEMPAGLSDRAEDVWEPLLALADLAGGDWAQRARRAATELSGKRTDDEDSHRVQLLRDIRLIFKERGVDEISSTELVFALNGIEESTWGGWFHGKGLSPHALARQLKQFGIAPGRTRDGSARGYSRHQFEDAFSRYLPAIPYATVKASETELFPDGGRPANHPNHDSSDSSENPAAALSGDVSDTLTLGSLGWASLDAVAPGAEKATEKWTPHYAEAESERLRRKFPDLEGPTT
jgi:hypothetical protein